MSVREFLKNLQVDLHHIRSSPGEMCPTSPRFEIVQWQPLFRSLISAYDIQESRSRFGQECFRSNLLRDKIRFAQVVDEKSMVPETIQDEESVSDRLSDAAFKEAIRVLLLPTRNARAVGILGLGYSTDEDLTFKLLNIATFVYQWWEGSAMSKGFQVAFDRVNMTLIIRPLRWRCDSVDGYRKGFYSILAGETPPTYTCSQDQCERYGLIFIGTISGFCIRIHRPLRHGQAVYSMRESPNASIDAILKIIVIEFIVRYQSLLRFVRVRLHRYNDSSDATFATDSSEYFTSNGGGNAFDQVVKCLKEYKAALREVLDQEG